MRTYFAEGGFRNEAGVLIDTGDGEWHPLRQHTRHSPDGHAWGYGGSGPAQLALDLLWDVYGGEPAPRLYQSFKDAVIANLDQSKGFSLTEASIREWVDTNGGFQHPPSF